MSNEERQQQNVSDRATGYAACLACIAADGLTVARALYSAGVRERAQSFGYWCGWLHACACGLSTQDSYK